MKKFILSLGILFLATSVYASQEKEYKFKVFLDDTEIGYHNFEIRPGSNQTLINSEANFDVKILFFSVYTYFHSNNEIWQGGCLRRIASSTNDNGDQLFVNGDLRSNGLDLKTHTGKEMLEGCVRTFAYWDPELLNSRQLLNVQTGELEDVNVQLLGKVFKNINGQEIAANQYRIDSDKFEINLWYTPQQEWIALESITENGARLKYVAQ